MEDVKVRLSVVAARSQKLSWGKNQGNTVIGQIEKREENRKAYVDGQGIRAARRGRTENRKTQVHGPADEGAALVIGDW